MATLKCTAQIKYVVRITFPDKKEYYLAPSVYKAKRLEGNPYRGFQYSLPEAQSICEEYKEKYPDCIVEAVKILAYQEFKKYYPEYKVRLSKVDYEEENCWQWDMAWDIERAANNLFDFLNYKIKYFPDETFYEWYVYADCKCRCLLVEQKEEGISKGFYHVYENDVVSVTSEKNNRRIMIYSKNGTILRVFNG